MISSSSGLLAGQMKHLSMTNSSSGGITFRSDSRDRCQHKAIFDLGTRIYEKCAPASASSPCARS